MKHIISIILVFVCVCALCACKTTSIPVEPSVSKDTVYMYKSWRDTTYLHDSVWVETLVKGDTIWKTKEVFKDRWHERFVHDTTYLSRTDTVRITVVTNELTSWQKLKIKAGSWAIVVLGFVIALLGLFVLARRHG